MRKTSTLLLALIATLMMSADGLSLRDKMYLRSLPKAESFARSMNNDRRVTAKAGHNFAVPSSRYVTALAKIDDYSAIANLEEAGATVIPLRHNYAMLAMKPSDAARIASVRGLRQMSLQRSVLPKMDRARAASGIDNIHQRLDLPKAYTGEGVVCGIVDNGFDTNHINFLTDDGKSRMAALSVAYIDYINQKIALDCYSDIEPNYPSPLSLATDDNTTYHGTHTLGIMAGGYKGNVIDVLPDEVEHVAKQRELPNPYYGVAYNADLAVGAGSGYDSLIAANLANIIGYAEYYDKPCVVNLSIGTTFGPHDGNNLFSQFLDQCAEEDGTIFCLAAGNEGDMPITVHKRFTAEDKMLKTFFDPYFLEEKTSQYGIRPRVGTLQIYSDTAEEFTLSVAVLNKKRMRNAWSKGIDKSMEGQGVYYVSSDAWKEDDSDIVDTNLGTFYQGYVGMGSDIDSETGRYMAIIEMQLWETLENDGNYLISLQISGKEGQRVDVYLDGLYMAFTDFDMAGWDNGMTNGTISDMACAKNVISVGAYNTRQYWGVLDGTVFDYGEELGKEGNVTWYSSYGTLADGRNLPDLVAPGLTVVSSMSKPYLDYIQKYYSEQGEVIDLNEMVTAKADYRTRKDYWYAEAGTSMATPIVAGVVAQMLEACPSLRYNEVRDILRRTAVMDEQMRSVADPVQVGCGKLDAYAAVKEAVKMSSVDGITTDANPMVRTVGENLYEVFVPSAEKLQIAVYNTIGEQVKLQSVAGSETVVDLNGLASGFYIMSINGSHSQKLQIK